MRRMLVLLALVSFASACTTASSSAPLSGTSSVPPTSATEPPPVATLADGSPLPGGCTGRASARQTVAFVADGRAWALDPSTRKVSCLFTTADPGAFAWGPQGDRVLLGGGTVAGLTKDAPAFPGIGQDAAVFDWGHPIGLALVFAGPDGAPEKRFMDDGRVESLAALPNGRYLQIAYHPSGLALAFVLERDGRQSIWLSTNEGQDPTRLVFPLGGTTFPSIAFSPDGRRLWWIAEHAKGYPELHAMDLADRSGFTDVWRGPDDTVATDLRIAPNGQLKSANEGTGCADRRALILAGGTAQPAMPLELRPTTGLGWLDDSTLLVAAGGCDAPSDLFAVSARGGDAPVALVHGAEIAAPRTILENAPDSVPEPSPADPTPPPGGVG